MRSCTEASGREEPADQLPAELADLQTATQSGCLPVRGDGSLGVAGVTNTVTMPVTVSPKPDGKVQFSGSVNTKMTDFKIIPPAPAVAGGAITTGDEVKLIFSWGVNRIVPRQ